MINLASQIHMNQKYYPVTSINKNFKFASYQKAQKHREKTGISRVSPQILPLLHQICMLWLGIDESLREEVKHYLTLLGAFNLLSLSILYTSLCDIFCKSIDSEFIYLSKSILWIGIPFLTNIICLLPGRTLNGVFKTILNHVV